ncbi:MAG TPA: aminotransferase class I/II-fold pyridoxal phosphate-dependent enzyme [Bacillales bacterium]|nr:aminotransferase class I/II-fold pyridoxal phosphate-dependent enzyme [Bacillales bacterium]
MKQNRAPIYEALVQFRDQHPLSFHVPGHKNGTVFAEKGKAFFEKGLSLDLTELPGLDDLHAPTGAIREAQQLLSSFYQTDRSWFLVGGSTVGNLAMVRAACGKGDQVLVARNCHRSVLNGIKLAGARPVFLRPRLDPESGLATAPSEDTVKEALIRYPDVRALLLTNPNYYGMAANIRSLIDQAHDHGLPVLVDEAHGAHFTAGPPFPESALRCGADAVVHSAHKTLPAMTMGAYLHVQGGRISQQDVSEALSMLQSSSPSYPIMASLDLARCYLAQLTETRLRAIHQDYKRIRERLGDFAYFGLIQGKSTAYEALDPLKITIQMKNSLNGFEISQRLEQEGIYPELADPDHVLFVLPLARFQEDDRLIKAMENVLHGIDPKAGRSTPVYPQGPRISCPADITKDQEKKTVPLEEGIGRLAAQEVTPYPPGVPLIIRGERITSAQIDAIQYWHAAGGRFQDGSDVVENGIHVVMRE